MNINGENVAGRLRTFLNRQTMLTTSEAVDMIATVRTLEEALVITKEEADELASTTAEKRA